jgi:hypothetical protein
MLPAVTSSYGIIQGEPAVRALRALRALLVYSFGFAALEAPWRTEPQPDQRRARSQAALAAAVQEFPAVARLAAPLGRQPTDEDFHGRCCICCDRVRAARLPAWEPAVVILLPPHGLPSPVSASLLM